jgi:ABC-type transport system involved in multi-copper enzyme maturation permease subunit
VDTRQASLIARYSARYSVRGGIGLVFLLLSLTFGLVVAQLTLQPVEMIVKQEQQQSKKKAAMDKDELTRRVVARMVPEVRPVVAWFLTPSVAPGAEPDEDAVEEGKRFAAHLTEEHPMLLSAILLILLYGWPLCASFGAFDLYAGDIASRQLRYQLLRADRASIYFGRLLGVMMTFVIVLTILGATIAIYMGLKLPIYAMGDLLAWAAYGVAALLVVTLPYVALCAWISASVSSSLISLTVTSAIIGGVPLVAMAGKFAWEPLRHVDVALPWGFQTRLFHPDWSQVGLAALGCIAQAALFTWLGFRKFTKRDL